MAEKCLTRNTRCSLTVIDAINNSSCCTYPEMFCIPEPKATPFTLMSPVTVIVLESVLAASALRRVVFPDPLQRDITHVVQETIQKNAIAQKSRHLIQRMKLALSFKH